MKEANDDYRAPTQSELEEKALTRLKENLPRKELKGMTSEDLKELAQLKAEATIRHAQDLITTGIFAHQAWSWAIRAEICGAEYD